jgi:uncharacterized repeat protein (TIGR03803 family)
VSKTRASEHFMIVLLALAVVAMGAPAHAQKYSVLYKFGTKNGDPVAPLNPGIIAQGRDGNLYSTAPEGGANGDGAVFKITPKGTLTVLHSFDGTDGSTPFSGLTLGTDGDFYGTTNSGGSLGNGTVFKITHSGNFTTLHNFAGAEGGLPYAPPIEGTDGNFYGTTPVDGGHGIGTVYKMTPSGVVTTLHTFANNDGANPGPPLVEGSDGNFYGTTAGGGKNEQGTIFKITSTGSLTTIHDFSCDNACIVYGPLIQGSDGFFYGVASEGGSGRDNPGTIFRVSSTGSFSVLYNFNGRSDGSTPYAGLVQASDNNLYGNTEEKGSSRVGTIYRITPQGDFSVLYNFHSQKGGGPRVTLIQNTNGILYGDTPANSSISVFYSLNANLPAFVTLLPYSGKVGKTIEFLGQGFTGTTAVSFNGTAAVFSVKSNTYLTAIVPAGATSGLVTVATPGGLLTSNRQFQVKP